MKKKVVIVSVAVILFLLVAMGIVITRDDAQVVTQMSFTKEISVVDHVAQQQEVNLEIVIEESDNYIFYGKWEADVPGLITGCRIYDEAGEVVFASTADSCTMNSVPLRMEEGKYTLTLSYIASMEQWKAFVGDEFNSEYEYSFASDGQFVIPYEFKFEKENSIFGTLILIATLIGLVLVVIIRAMTKKDDDIKGKYDERQELVRGRGFKYAFFAILITNLLYSMVADMGITFPMDANIALVINSLIGICVCASYCIWNDGYFALNEKVGSIMTILIIVGIINFVIGILAFASGAAIQDGRLTFRSINLFCGIMVIVICGVLILKKFYKDRKDD